MFGRGSKKTQAMRPGPAVVFAIQPDDKAIRQARSAGKKDGGDLPPPLGQATPFVMKLRSETKTLTRDNVTAATTRFYRIKARVQAESAKGASAHTILSFLSDLDELVDRLENNFKAALQALEALEQAYLDEAGPRWDRKNYPFHIPGHDTTDDAKAIEELKGKLSGLKKEVGY
ncbi:MAG: hypothetical protein WCF36_21045 [Candidatus Nanopelagicales bacterium]